MGKPKQTKQQEQPVVLWAYWGESPLFVRASEAKRLGDLWEGLDSSKTVGDLRRRFPAGSGVMEDVLSDIGDSPEAWTPEMEAVYEEDEDLGLDDVPDSFPFDSDAHCERHYDWRGSIGGVFDLSWFPDKDVRDACTDSGGSMTGGELITFRPGTEDEVVACLEAHGYRVVRDDVSVMRALG